MSEPWFASRLVAIALVLGQHDGAAGDNVPQEVWDALYDEGLLANAEDQTGERTAFITAEGYAALIDGLRADKAANSPELREGLHMVYEHGGRYVGCIGSETWQTLVAAVDD